MRSDIFNALIIVLTTFAFSAILMPIMMKIAHHIGAVDVPRSTEGNRHIHKKPIPKLGGIGIFIGFISSVILVKTIIKLPISIEFIFILGVPKIIKLSIKLRNTPNPPNNGVAFLCICLFSSSLLGTSIAPT